MKKFIKRCLSFSLPTQRCFLPLFRDRLRPSLFSAYAEVFPAPAHRIRSRPSFLCLRRGVSHGLSKLSAIRFFSLPTQRCFYIEAVRPDLDPLFSAYAEVFPPPADCIRRRWPFLCLRRGVSVAIKAAPALARFSLPTQRCFPDYVAIAKEYMLFSAYAEVFLQNCLKPSSDFSFLCLRRGVSWFIGRHPLCEELFSAYAEVFLHHWRPGLAQLTFLCLRRGVSRSGGPCVLTRCFSLPTQRCFHDVPEERLLW